MTPRKPFLLRVDPKLLDSLQRWANDELRSLNGHIEFLLRRELRAAGRAPKPHSAGAPPAVPPPGIPAGDDPPQADGFG